MVSRREKIAYGLGDAASNIVFQTVMLFLGVYYTDVLGISAAAVGTIFLVVRIFDAVTDPLMGYITDRTRTRWGRYRPYLLWLSLPFGVTTVLAFTGSGLAGFGRTVYAVITYALLMAVYTGINIPYCALGGALSTDPGERVSIQSYRFVLAWVGGLLVTTSVMPLADYLGAGDPALGYSRSMMVLAAAGVGMFLLCFLGTKERTPVPAEVSTGPWSNVLQALSNERLRILCMVQVVLLIGIVARNAASVYFVHDVLGREGSTRVVSAFMTVGMLGQIGGGLISDHLCRWTDKHLLVPTLHLLAAAFSASAMILPARFLELHFVLHFIWAASVACGVPILWAMLSDAADYGVRRSGEELTGTVFAVNLFAIKMGMALGGTLGAWILAGFGYDGQATFQSRSALVGILIAFSIVPAGASMLVALIMQLYHPERDIVRILRRKEEGRA